jgi:hypothetical protein
MYAARSSVMVGSNVARQLPATVVTYHSPSMRSTLAEFLIMKRGASIVDRARTVLCRELLLCDIAHGKKPYCRSKPFRVQRWVSDG